MVKNLFRTCHKRFIQPRSTNPDDQRREYIFNVLIGFFTLAAAATTISSGITHILGANAHKTNSVPETIGFLLFTAGLWWLSRRCHYKFGAYTLIVLVWLAGLQLTLAWSLELPMAQLLNILVIIVAGITLSSRAALMISFFTSFSTLVIGYLQSAREIPVDTSWLTKHLEFSDAIGLVVIYIIVGAISWLANNEIDNLLRRAWKSESALAKQRDQLEVTVAKRTKELERTQLERVLELQKFAEFGRVSASLLHDLANPLTAAALNLEEAGGRRGSKLVDQAMVSLGYIEDYIASARKQLRGDSDYHLFSVSSEIAEIIELIRNQASKAKVAISLTADKDDTVFGDSIAFARVMANLLVNAIQAYKTSTKTHKSIQVTVENHGTHITIGVQDYGVGIKAIDLPHIFEDFYSTKKQIGRGLGLGLANAKLVIERDFSGSITVSSSPRSGTLFTLELPIHESSNRTNHSKRLATSGAKPNRQR